MAEAKRLGAPYELVAEVAETGKLPVVNFSAGGIATPADAALMMQLGADGNFVGSGIFKSDDPLGYAKAIVAATTYFDKPEVIAEVSAGLGKAMRGIAVATLPTADLLATGGWGGRSRPWAPSPASEAPALGGNALHFAARSSGLSSSRRI